MIKKGTTMNKSKRQYQKKCKSRNIDFYLHEKELYEFSKTINFQKFVKDKLKSQMIIEELRKEM